MASSIDETKPAAGSPTTLSVRQNFNNAKSEINSLLRMSEDVVTSVYLAGAYSATFTNPPSLDNGTRITVLASAPCQDNPSISINGSSGKPIVHLDGSNLKANEIIGSNSHYLDLMYNSANTGSWVLMNPAHLTPNTLNLTGDVTGSVNFDTSDSKNLSTTVDPLIAYPIGSVYISVSTDSPATLFGGSWDKIASDLVLSSALTDSDLGTTDGSNTRTISTANLPTHSHHMFNGNTPEGPNPDLTSGDDTVAYIRGLAAGGLTNSNFEYEMAKNTGSGRADLGRTSDTGNGTAFNVRQKSYYVNMWVRTA